MWWGDIFITSSPNKLYIENLHNIILEPLEPDHDFWSCAQKL